MLVPPTPVRPKEDTTAKVPIILAAQYKSKEGSLSPHGHNKQIKRDMTHYPWDHPPGKVSNYTKLLSCNSSASLLPAKSPT